MPKRKLIEAAIPLDAINAACKADKQKAVGTIRNLHKWFAPMPLPAWRALLFAALVDDADDERERDRLMRIIEDLMRGGAEPPPAEVLERARQEIAKSWPAGTPVIADPFCGGGSTLVEAQRLGCETYGSDLNPIPVVMSKLLTELLPPLAGMGPLHPTDGRFGLLSGPYDGVAADVRYYAKRASDAVKSEIGEWLESDSDGIPTAWIWARSVLCPNPACGVETVLATTWSLSKKAGAERWIEPVVDGTEISFRVSGPHGQPQAAPKSGRGANFVCLRCEATLDEKYIARQGLAGGLGTRMLAVIERRADQRVYRAATAQDEEIARGVPSVDHPPEVRLPANPRWFSPPLFGLATQADLYTPRQLLVLDRFASAVAASFDEIRQDGGDERRAKAIVAILGMVVAKLAQFNSSQVRWNTGGNNASGRPEAAFGRHDVPMTWDFVEVNPFGSAVGDFRQLTDLTIRALSYVPASGRGTVEQRDARTALDGRRDVLIATDPPYFDQIGYADLSDYFYVWHRRALRGVFPDIFATVAAPKEGELIALGTRHGGDRARAKRYFIDGFSQVFEHLGGAQHPDVPMLIVYAFKERAKSKAGDEISPGWEAILDALVHSGAEIIGTWPINATGSTRLIGIGTNALATYVVLVCRPRERSAPRITKSELTRLLKARLAGSVAELQKANIAPVDLAQVVIGPGMQVYSRHSAVIETDGSPLRVADALGLINRTLAEVLDEQEGDLDPDSRWAVTWYDDHGFDTAAFGKADQLARAKGIAVDSLVEAGIVTSGAGKVALIGRDAFREGWDPATDRRATAWEAVQYLVRSLAEGGERAAAELYARLGGLADPARELAYRLFQIAEKKGRTEEAIAYNGLVTSWSEIARLADDLPRQPAATATEALF